MNGHLEYKPLKPNNIPNKLIKIVLNEYITEYFCNKNNITTKHHKLKKNIKTTNIIIDNISYKCYFNV